MIPDDFTIETTRLRLRQATAADVDFVFAAALHPGFCEGMRWDPPATPGELIPILENNLAAWRQGQAFSFTAERRADGLPVGRIGIRRAEQAGDWSIGYWTHPEFFGHGYATEAARAVLTFGFETLNARRIEASHALWNRASRRVLEKVGMTFFRHEPEGFRKRGAWVAEDVLDLDRERWRELGGRERRA